MKFPNAYKGVKKLFICELILIITGILFVVAAILAAVGIKNEGALLAAGGMILGTGIAAIVVFILQLVGLHQGGKDEILIKNAFFATILGILVGVVSSTLGGLKNQTDALKIVVTILDSVETLATLFASYYVLLGISSLSGKLSDKAMEKEGKSLANWVVCLFAVSIVLDVLGGIFKALPSSPEWLNVIAAILAIGAAIAELVVYVVTVLYYKKAVKMLKK